MSDAPISDVASGADGGRLGGGRPAERAAAHDVAALSGEEPGTDTDGLPEQWRQGPQVSSRHDLVGHVGLVAAVAVGTVDGQTVIASGGSDGTVRLWDARTGTPRGRPLRHDNLVRCVAMGVLDGRPVVVSGGENRRSDEFSVGTICVWDARTGRPWDLVSGLALHRVLRHHHWVYAVALGIVDGAPVIVSGGGRQLEFVDSSTTNGTIYLWDVRTGRRRGKARTHGSGGSVEAVAVGEIDSGPVLVSAGFEYRVGDTVQLWDARTGRERGGRRFRLPGGSAVRFMVTGVVDGRLMIVGGADEGTVWRWDAGRGVSWGEPLRHGDRLAAVTVGEVGGEPVIVSAGDGTLRLWDARSGAPLSPPIDGYITGGVAIGLVDDHPILVSGSHDGAVRVWDIRTGEAGSA